MLRVLSLALALAFLPVGAAFADEEHAEGAAAEAAEGEHGAHGGPISLHEIVAGHESLQFWGAVVNFILLVVLIRMMSKKPLAGFLTERKRSVEVGIVEAAEMKKKAEAVWQEYNERMKTLDAELAKLRADMAASAEADKARIVAEAKESSERLRVETAALIARQAEQLEAQIRHEVVNAAIAAAERAVKEAANADDQERLAESFAKELARAGVEKRA